jgi:hypothetical protein
MCSPSPPPAPDYAELARQQGAANVETARVEGAINRPDIYTPNGSQVWTRDPNNPDHYILTQSLNPQLTDNNNQLNWIQGAALQALGDYGVPAINQALSQSYSLSGTPQMGWDQNLAPGQNLQTESGMWAAPAVQERLDYSGVPAMPEASDATRTAAENAMYNRASRYLDPQFATKRSDLEAKLANQGITMGSDAYNAENEALGREEAMAYGDARDRAIMMGGEEMARQFGLGMQSRQQGVGEVTQQGQFANTAQGQLVSQLLQDMAQRNAAIQGQANLASSQQQASTAGRSAALAELAQSKTLPINILSALLSQSQVNAPQYQPFNNQIQVQPPPIMQGGQLQDQANMNRYNAGQANMANWINAGAGLGSAWLMSDRRLKSDVRRIGTWKGYPWYEYTIDGQRVQGVMADEVPVEFTITLPSGYKMVNYGALAEA